MKILYIGHFREGAGWTKAAINNVLALSTQDVDIVCRDIKLTDNATEVPDLIKKYEENNLQDIDVCIQHVLPHFIVGSQKFKKNIACTCTENTTIKNTRWYQHLDLADEVWVPSYTNQKSLLKDGLKNVKMIPYGFDIDSYEHEELQLQNIGVNGFFKFYFIGDLNDRKNLPSVIRAFHSEFDRNEPVELIIKSHQAGLPDDVCGRKIQEMCNSIKKNMRMYENIGLYKNEIVVTQYLSDADIQKLHSIGDCFVCVSHGESFSIPAFEAMIHGNTPICSNEGGPATFIDPENKNTGYLINGVYTVCEHSNPAIPESATGKQEWFTPDEAELKKAMRFYFENREQMDKKQGEKHAYKFDLKNIGQKMLEEINV